MDLDNDETVQLVTAAVEKAEETGTPQLLGRGRYALYATPEGGMHLSYRPEGLDTDQHLPIPAAMLRMFTARSEGAGMFEQFRALTGL